MSLSIQIEPALEVDMDSGSKSAAGRWTQEEHNVFLQGLKMHNKQWKLIADMVKTRTVVQIRTHAQKYFQKLNKTNGWNKCDKLDDATSPYVQQEQDGQRTYAYQVTDSRANSFCSSGDSVDSNGTSAEGVDSEGEIVNGMRIPGKPRSNVIRSNSFAYDHAVYSGSTSTSNSTLSSPTGQGMNMQNLYGPGGMQGKRAPNVSVLKVKPAGGGELVRKRSRDCIKSMLPGEVKVGLQSPKKNFSEAVYVTSLKSRSDPDVHPSRPNSTTSPSITFRTNANTYKATGMPGPLGGLSDDLGAGMSMGLGLDMGGDFYFPSGQFPDDPYSSGFGQTSGLGCASTDTDMLFPAQSSNVNYGYGLIDHDGFDDADLMNILGTIDWNEPEPSSIGHPDSASTTCANSRPLSPATDTASSVSSGLPSVSRPSPAGSNIPVKAPSPMPSLSAPAPLAPLMCIAENENDSSRNDEAPSPKKHRVAYSNVIEELELVSQAVRDNSAGNAGSGDADHISLFDLFQRDGSQAIGRLPPLRALVDRARQRESRTRSLSEGIASEDLPAPRPNPIPSVTNSSASVPSHNSVNFDDHEFDFMGDDFPYDGPGDLDGGVMPLLYGGSSSGSSIQVPPTPPASRTTSSDLFAGSASILDANGAINMNGTLLTLSMKPTVKVGSAPSSAASTPGASQRKRGRPRKYSITNPPGPLGTPSASTAKSLLPAMTHSLSGVPLQGNAGAGGAGANDGQNYVVPVNAAVAQAYNYAVSAALNSADFSSSGRSISSDRSIGLSAGGVNPSTVFGANIRLGMTRTMSSESDNMMAAAFDPKLYDSADMDNMLDEFD